MPTTNIKVEVSYVEPNADKFDALLLEYRAAKNLADMTETHHTPLISACAEEKAKLIYKQLHTIVDYLIELIKIGKGFTKSVETNIPLGSGTNHRPHSAKVKVDCNGVYEIFLDGYRFNGIDISKEWIGQYGIITNWNNLNIYGRLEEACIKMLSREIEAQKKKTTELNAILYNIINK